MKHRKKDKAMERLATRQADYDNMSSKSGHKRPGSQNPHKGVGSGGRKAAGARRR